MNYGDIVNSVSNESTGGNKQYLPHGINENVVVSKVELININTANYTGDAIDFTLTNEEAAELRTRIFPFNFNSSLKHNRGDKSGEFVTIEEQQNDYLARIKHIFTKAFGEAKFNEAMTKVTSFATLGKVLAVGASKIQNKFAIMLIDRKGYASVPTWTGGFCALTGAELASKWNEDKYGKKTSTGKVVEKPSSSSSSSSANDIFDLV